MDVRISWLIVSQSVFFSYVVSSWFLQVILGPGTFPAGFPQTAYSHVLHLFSGLASPWIFSHQSGLLLCYHRYWLLTMGLYFSDWQCFAVNFDLYFCYVLCRCTLNHNRGLVPKFSRVPCETSLCCYCLASFHHFLSRQGSYVSGWFFISCIFWLC